MASNDLLDYNEFDAPKMNWEAVSLPIRLMSFLLFLNWVIQLLNVFVPSLTNLYWEYSTILDWVRYGVGFWVVISLLQVKESPIPKYRTAFWLGVIFSMLHWLLSMILGWGITINLLYQMAFFLSYNAIFLILIYTWRRREGAGIWWSLWEKWAYVIVAADGVVSLTYWLGGNFLGVEYELVKAMSENIRIIFLFVGSAYFFVVENAKHYTVKERLVCRLSWVILMASNLAMYLDSDVFTKILVGISIVLVVALFYQVLQVPDPKGQRWSNEAGGEVSEQ